MRTTLAVVITIAIAGRVFAAGRPITTADLLSLERVSEPQVSPDGSRVVYTLGTPDVAANRTARNVWIASVQTGEARALTATGGDSSARWAPDGRRIAFVSSRNGSAQIWTMTVDPPGEAVKITNVSGGADNIVWSPDGRTIAFTSEVYPDCHDDACNVARDEAHGKSAAKPRLYDRLLYRHWTAWSDGKRHHLFVVASTGGVARDLTPAAAYDVPPREREGPHPIAFAPDGRTIAFTAVTDRVEATSTNGDLFEIAVDGGTSNEPRRLTTNPGFDGAPAYSPDGKTLAYRSQARAGYEADKWRLMVYDRGSTRHTSLTDGLDRSVDSFEWSSDGRSIYFNAEDKGAMPVFVVSPGGPAPRRITAGRFDGEFDVGGSSLVVARSTLAAPPELYRVATDSGSAQALTHHNDARLAALDIAKPESFTFQGAGGAEVQGFLVRPPAFDPSKRYPVLLLIHGGPQNAWGDTWSYRWNAQMFATSSSIVVMINPRGSTGFGQKFTDDINADWGGKPYQDLMAGLDFVLAKYSFTDRDRVAAAGASYGGYMIDWLASQSKGRFRALVSHAGVYNLTSMYGATEELWFPERDFGGTPWTNSAVYQKLSPSSYAEEFGKFKTPTLVIAGEQDYRVPYTQSLEFFTALQRQDVPSKLLLFPDEGHWILKPQNSIVWYQEVLAWLGERLH